MRVFSEDIGKIKYKSMYDLKSYGPAAYPGQYFWILRLKFSSSWDSLMAYEPETQSMVFKEWKPYSLYEYA